MRICVVGDLGVDVNVSCVAKKIASEAPIPVFEELETSHNPAMAANVAAMCDALGAETLLIGVLGDDDIAGILDDNENGFQVETVEATWNCTTVKKRYFDVRDGQRHLVARFDKDCGYQCELSDALWMVKKIEQFSPDAVIIQDHNKGVVTRHLMKQVTQLPYPVFVDPSPSTHVPLTPASWVGGFNELPNGEHRVLLDDATALIVKKGAGGISCVIPDKFDIPAYCKNPINSCGAGDTFISALVVARLDGKSWREACEWASAASSVVVGRYGMEPPRRVDITAAMKDHGK